MNKYDVGFEDCLIGCYIAESEEEAIQQCKSELLQLSLEQRRRITNKNALINIFAILRNS
jgi:hypothetical protein